MTSPEFLVATWDRGLFTVTAAGIEQELAGQSVLGLIRDGADGLLAILTDHRLHRRSGAGEWREILRSEVALSCWLTIGDKIIGGLPAPAPFCRFDSNLVAGVTPGVR